MVLKTDLFPNGPNETTFLDTYASQLREDQENVLKYLSSINAGNRLLQ